MWRQWAGLSLSLGAGDIEEHDLCYGVKRGKCKQIWNMPKPHKHQHQINTNLKNTNHMFYSVRGRLLGYAQNRSHRDFKYKVCNCLIELQ